MNDKINQSLKSFEINAVRHGEATLKSEYKTCNQSYPKIKKAKDYLTANGELASLTPLLEHQNISVKIWAARYLLFLYEERAKAILNEIANSDIGTFSTDAAYTLQE